MDKHERKEPEQPVPQQLPPEEPPTKMDAIKKNPNPRANENLPEDIQEGEKDFEQEGPGTEVTDGEDG